MAVSMRGARAGEAPARGARREAVGGAPGLRVARCYGHLELAVARRGTVVDRVAGDRCIRERAVAEARRGRGGAVDLGGRAGAGGRLGADPVGEGVPVAVALAGLDRGVVAAGERDRRPGAGEGVARAVAVVEWGLVALDDGACRIETGAGVGAVVEGDRDRGRGVVAAGHGRRDTSWRA